MSTVDERPGSLDAEGDQVGALTVLRRGIQISPELRKGFRITLVMALCMAAGRLVIPVLIQQILDQGIRGDDGYRPGFVYGACLIAVAVIVGVGILSRFTYMRLIKVAETMLMELRQRTFAHIHRLSLADHVGSRTGVLTARVHIVLPDNNPFGETTRPSSAAVFVKSHQDELVRRGIGSEPGYRPR